MSALADYPSLSGYFLSQSSSRQTHIHPFLYILYNIYIYIVICVPSLVEIVPGFPELCWNIHTHKHI
jgi:hypothetical protein